MKDLLRTIPKVDEVLKAASWERLKAFPQETAKNALRSELDRIRAGIKDGSLTAVPSIEEIVEQTVKKTRGAVTPGLKRVINGTGVIIHTNLGRSILAKSVTDRLTEIAAGYSNLEYDLSSGKRGDRYEHCLSLLTKLTGAESALVVNNNAAAVFLALNTVAEGKEVIIARGELIEIGGSFRIPEIMAKSGAILREVGTTNRTFIDDYRRAINATTGLIMKAHTSNYRIRGFVHEEQSADISELARSSNIPFYYDFGSGLFSPLGSITAGEPSIAEESAKQIDVISGSGDKLLGGPQAGILLGKKELIAAMKKNPLARTFRPDKFTLAALESTLLLYLDPEKAREEIPTLRMLDENPGKVKTRAIRIAGLIKKSLPDLAIDVVPVYSEVGGGSMPDVAIPSYALSLNPSHMSAVKLEEQLRHQETPVVGRMEKGKLLLDVRTIQTEEEKNLVASIRAALQDGR